MPPEFDVAYDAVLDAVESGELTEERIDDLGTPDPDPQARPRHRRRPVRRPGPGAAPTSAPPTTWRPCRRSPTAPRRWCERRPDAAVGGGPRRQRARHRLGRHQHRRRRRRAGGAGLRDARSSRPGSTPVRRPSTTPPRVPGSTTSPSRSPTGPGWPARRARPLSSSRLTKARQPVVGVAVRDAYDVEPVPEGGRVRRDVLLHRGRARLPGPGAGRRARPDRPAARDHPPGRQPPSRSTPTATDWSTDMTWSRRTFLRGAATGAAATGAGTLAATSPIAASAAGTDGAGGRVLTGFEPLARRRLPDAGAASGSGWSPTRPAS